MLTLSRRIGESIVIGGNLVVTVREMKNGRVRLAFDASPDVLILRKELVERDARRAEWAAPAEALEAADEPLFAEVSGGAVT